MEKDSTPTGKCATHAFPPGAQNPTHSSGAASDRFQLDSFRQLEHQIESQRFRWLQPIPAALRVPKPQRALIGGQSRAGADWLTELRAGERPLGRGWSEAVPRAAKRPLRRRRWKRIHTQTKPTTLRPPALLRPPLPPVGAPLSQSPGFPRPRQRLGTSPSRRGPRRALYLTSGQRARS